MMDGGRENRMKIRRNTSHIKHIPNSISNNQSKTNSDQLAVNLDINVSDCQIVSFSLAGKYDLYVQKICAQTSSEYGVDKTYISEWKLAMKPWWSSSNYNWAINHHGEPLWQECITETILSTHSVLNPYTTESPQPSIYCIWLLLGGKLRGWRGLAWPGGGGGGSSVDDSPLTVRCTQLPLWKVSYCCSSIRTRHSYQPWSSGCTGTICRDAFPWRLARPEEETERGRGSERGPTHRGDTVYTCSAQTVCLF